MIALLVVIVLIPLLVSQAEKKADPWTETMNTTETFESLKELEKLETIEGLENLPEVQAELDSILEAIDIPELDSFIFVIPELPFRENGKTITISKTAGLPHFTVSPEIIGGYDSLLEHLVYPEELKKDGIEGTVIVQIHVEQDGSIDKTHLLKSSGYDSFDKAALEAVMKIKFEHIYPDDKPDAVWLALPVIFKLEH